MWFTLVAASLLVASTRAKPLRIAVVGDAGEGTESQRRAFAAVDAAAPDVVLSTGDNFYEEGLPAPNAEAEALIWGALRTRPLWGVPGNHDHRGDPTAPSFVPARSYERWLAPDVQLLAIDTTPMLSSSGLEQQWEWIESRLRLPKPRWRIVLGHHPVRSATKHCDEQRESKARLDRLLVDADLYISGHTHCFETCDGGRHITVGSTARLNSVRTVCSVAQTGCTAVHERGWAMITIGNGTHAVKWHSVEAVK